MRPGPRNAITDVPGLTVGQASDRGAKTGVSVLVGDRPMVAGVHAIGRLPKLTPMCSPHALSTEG